MIFMGPKVAVFGSGAGGLAAAATIAQRGHDVVVYSAYKSMLDKQGIQLEEAGVIKTLSVQIKSEFPSLAELDYALIVCPADAREYYLQQVVARTGTKTKIVLIPGGLGFGLNHLEQLQNRGWYELNQLPYVARKTDGNAVTVHYRLPKLWCAAYPASDTTEAKETLDSLLGLSLGASEHTLHCGFFNWNMLLHPPLMLTNAGRIERQERFTFYREGVNTLAINVMEEMDRERRNVMQKLGLFTPSLSEYLSGGKTMRLEEAVRTDAATGEVMAPTSLQHRYLTEDVPYNVVPLAWLGDILTIDTPTVDAVVQWYHCLTQEPSFSSFAIKRLVGMSPKEINLCAKGIME